MAIHSLSINTHLARSSSPRPQVGGGKEQGQLVEGSRRVCFLLRRLSVIVLTVVLAQDHRSESGQDGVSVLQEGVFQVWQLCVGSSSSWPPKFLIAGSGPHCRKLYLGAASLLQLSPAGSRIGCMPFSPHCCCETVLFVWRSWSHSGRMPQP